MVKKLEWTKPVLVELGSARRMTFGEGDLETAQGFCHIGTGADTCGVGNSVIPLK
jgi:hypothetical protein